MDQEPKQELSSTIQKDLLMAQIREEMLVFNEEHPLGKGEYFGNFEQNFPGGWYRKFSGLNKVQDNFLKAVDEALIATAEERQKTIIHYMSKSQREKPLINIIKNLRLRIETKASKARGQSNERRLEKTGEELARLNDAITDILLPPYLVLRSKGYSHEIITS